MAGVDGDSAIMKTSHIFFDLVQAFGYERNVEDFWFCRRGRSSCVGRRSGSGALAFELIGLGTYIFIHLL